MHPFQYGYSDPVNNSDPSGKIVIFFHGGWDDTSLDPLITELKPMIDGDILELKANDTSTAYKAMERFNNPSICFSEPIVLIGYSRGGASVQAVANTMSNFAPLMKIQLAITIAPVEFGHWEGVPTYKLPNVQKHINFLSMQKGAAAPTSRTYWPQPLSPREFYINGAENIDMPETSHFSVVEQPMSVFKPYKPYIPPKSNGVPPPEYIKYDEINPSPVWERIKTELAKLKA